jgi:hypothetical protein
VKEPSFEKHLAVQPLRDIPGGWRAKILAEAQTHKKSSAIAALGSALHSWLWPHPIAWAAIAAGWVVAAGLMVSGPHGEELAVTPKQYRDLPVPSPAEYYAQLRICRLLATATFDDANGASIQFVRPRLDVAPGHE